MSLPDENGPEVYSSAKPLAIEYHFRVYGEIGEVENYIELMETLDSATELDHIYIHINTPGGNLYTAIPLVQAMRDSLASVVTVAEGEVKSAGSIILFAGEYIQVNPHCSFLLHDGSSGEIGKINENAKSANHVSEVIKGLYLDVYQPYFTEEEIVDVLSGKDLYLTSSEVSVRIEAVLNSLEEMSNEVDS